MDQVSISNYAGLANNPVANSDILGNVVKFGTTQFYTGEGGETYSRALKKSEIEGIKREWSRAMDLLRANGFGDLADYIESDKITISQLQRPTLVTEGKTDVLILNEAWKKLFPNQDCPFEIIAGDTSGDTIGGNGGASVLHHFANSVTDSDNKKIVLWDYDEQGLKGFKLNNNFEIDKKYDCLKIHKNKKAFGIILPNHEDLNDYYEAENLPIEFYFDKEDFEKKDEHNNGLSIEPLKRKIQMGKKEKEIILEERCYSKIKGDKISFANNIVPTLHKRSFRRFEKLFEIINYALSTNF